MKKQVENLILYFTFIFTPTNFQRYERNMSNTSFVLQFNVCENRVILGCIFMIAHVCFYIFPFFVDFFIPIFYLQCKILFNFNIGTLCSTNIEIDFIIWTTIISLGMHTFFIGTVFYSRSNLFIAIHIYQFCSPIRQQSIANCAVNVLIHTLIFF